ncbi:17017_t:CDS:10 [Entrophospora sp. SA101]|nr:17017_t:CDS:10 [Entrophospora sp. SA101]
MLKQSNFDSSKASSDDSTFDLLVIGGGAVGSGVALDAATRGLKVALVERDDFSSGTSSRSTKLVHGGVRYLEKAFRKLDYGQFKLVREALHERATFLHIAPYLSQQLPIMLPIYRWWQIPYYWAGTKAYELLSGKEALESSYFLTRSKALEVFPMLKKDKLVGAIVFYDGQHNDARMNVAVALTAAYYGAAVANHVEVIKVLKDESGTVNGARLRDNLTDEEWDVKAKGVISATGAFADGLRSLDDPKTEKIVAPSSGTHIILPNYYSPRNMGLLDPLTSDNRIIFLLPWEGNVIAGTTDSPADVTFEPLAKEEEIQWILEEIKRYLSADIKVRRGDVLAAWSGIRPLVRDPNAKNTSELVRSHMINVSDSKLITIAGGKWTTYRAMAEDTVDKAIEVYGLNPLNGSRTKDVKLIGSHGYSSTMFIKLIQQFGLETEVAQHLSNSYGDRAWAVAALSEPTEFMRSQHASEEAINVLGREKHELHNEVDKIRAELNMTKSLMIKNEQKIKDGDNGLRCEMDTLRDILSLHLGLSDDNKFDQFEYDSEFSEIIASYKQLQSSARNYLQTLGDNSDEVNELATKVKKASQLWQQNLQILAIKLKSAQKFENSKLKNEQKVREAKEIDSNKKIISLEFENSRLKSELENQELKEEARENENYKLKEELEKQKSIQEDKEIDLNEKIVSLESENGILEEKLEKQKLNEEDKETVSIEIASLEAENNKLKEELEKQKMEEEANSNTIASLEAENNKLKEELEKQKMDEEANSNTITSLEAEINKLREDLEKQKMEGDKEVDLNEKIASLEADNSKLKEELEEQNKLKEESEKQKLNEEANSNMIVSLKAENNKLKEEFEKQIVKEDKEVDSNKIISLEAENSKLKEELEKQRMGEEDKETSLNEKITSLEAEINQLKEELEKQKLNEETNSNTIVPLESEINRLKEELEKQKLNEEANSNKITALETENSKLKEELEKQMMGEEDKETGLNKKITSLETEINELKEELEKQKLNEEANSNKIASLEAENSKLKEELEKQRMGEEDKETGLKKKITSLEAEIHKLKEESEKQKVTESEKQRVIEDKEFNLNEKIVSLEDENHKLKEESKKQRAVEEANSNKIISLESENNNLKEESEKQKAKEKDKEIGLNEKITSLELEKQKANEKEIDLNETIKSLKEELKIQKEISEKEIKNLQIETKKNLDIKDKSNDTSTNIESVAETDNDKSVKEKLAEAEAHISSSEKEKTDLRDNINRLNEKLKEEREGHEKLVMSWVEEQKNNKNNNY